MTTRRTGQRTDAPTSAALPDERDGDVRAAWAARVRQRQLGDGVRDVRTVRVFGRSGDEAVYVPLVESLAVLERDPVARWAVAEAERIIRAKQRQGAQVHVLTSSLDASGLPQSRVFDPEEPLDPTLDVSYLVLSRVVGG